MKSKQQVMLLRLIRVLCIVSAVAYPAIAQVPAPSAAQIPAATAAQAAPQAAPQSATRISLEDAIEMALQHNHNMLAAMTTIQQSEAQEITANFRPNPNLTVDWEYLPFFTPSSFTGDYLHDSTEGDVGLSYLIERGQKERQHQSSERAH